MTGPLDHHRWITVGFNRPSAPLQWGASSRHRGLICGGRVPRGERVLAFPVCPPLISMAGGSWMATSPRSHAPRSSPSLWTVGGESGCPNQDRRPGQKGKRHLFQSGCSSASRCLFPLGVPLCSLCPQRDVSCWEACRGFSEGRRAGWSAQRLAGALGAVGRAGRARRGRG